MKLNLLLEKQVNPDKIHAYVKHLVNQDKTNVEDVLTLYKYMYGHISSDKLYTQKDGIFDLYEYFSPKVDDNQKLTNYVISLSNHPSWIAMLVMYSLDLGDDFADRDMKFYNKDLFQKLLESMLNKEWTAYPLFINRFLDNNLKYIEEITQENPELLQRLDLYLDDMDLEGTSVDNTNLYSLEVLEKKYGSVLPKRS